MMSVWHELLSNLAVVAIATAIWTFSYRHLMQWPQRMRSLTFGVVMSVGVLAVMALPFHFREGVYLDTRYTFLALSGFFAGPWAAVLPLLTAITRRIAIGGTGLSIALPHIVAATTFGLLGHKFTRNRIPSLKILIVLACAVAASGTLGFYWSLPHQIWWQASIETVLPFAAILFGATLLSAGALTQELHRHTATIENRIYRAIIEALPDCLNAKDMDGRFIVANPATAKLMGAETSADLQGRTDADFYPAETARNFRQAEIEMMVKDEPIRIRQNFIKTDGQETWLSTLKAPLRDEFGHLIGLITHNKEVTEQRRLEFALTETRARLESAISSMADGLAMFDSEGRLVYQNEKHGDLFPLTADLRQPGVHLCDIVKASLERGETPMTGECIDKLADRTTQELLSPGDRIFPLANGRWVETRTRSAGDGGTTIVFSDITENRQREQDLCELNARLAALADTDGLTGVANRRAFDREMEKVTKGVYGEGKDIGLLMIDVDHFKAFNDAYGHPAGDQCLRRVAGTIASLVGASSGATIARYGGEEFAVILPDMSATETIEVAQWICRAVRDLAIDHVGSNKGVVTASVGATTWRETSTRDIGQFLRRADQALYEAKTAGRGCVRGLNRPRAA
jgi:diguanylate cyclase (GGDEF)-like protein/PAS domain S-box-containing protein